MDLSGLARMSAAVGADITLVQGAGGNSSVKEDGVLWVKASGTWLADAERRPIFVAVDLERARRAIADGDERIPALDPDAPLRPSIETSLHALMPHRAVLHVHGVNTLVWAVRPDAQPELARRLAGMAWAWVPYRRPGVPLSVAVAEAVAGRCPDVLVLANHGLVVGADDSDAAAALARAVEARLRLPARAAPPADPARLAALAQGHGYRPAAHDDSHGPATDPDSLAVAIEGSLYPDHVVFLGPGALAAAPGPTLDGALAAARAPCILVIGLGTLVRSDLSPGAEAMLRCLGLVTARVPPGTPVRYLTAQDEAALLSWDAERYRQALAVR